MQRAGDRPRLLSVLRVVDDPRARARAAIAAEGARHLVEAAPRVRGHGAGRDGARDEPAAGRGHRALAARRRDLLLDGRGDVQRILAFEQTMIGSDGLPHDAAPHPRLWGTLPARARALLARAWALPARDRRPQDDRADRADLRPADRGVLKQGACRRPHRSSTPHGRTRRRPSRSRSGGEGDRDRDRQRRDRLARRPPTGARPGRVLGRRPAN